MANTQYNVRNTDLNHEDKFLTVGGLISILQEVNPDTKVFIRNLDEWGEKPVIKGGDGFNSYQVSDGLIENIIKADINQVTGEYDYIIIQGLINYQGFHTLDFEPFQEVMYHHTWLDKCLKKIAPIETMKQLKNRFLKVEHCCGTCSHEDNGFCDCSKLKVNNSDVCDLWEYVD